MDPQIFSKTKRLSNDSQYVRPKKTYQDSLSSDDIKEKLKEYKRVTDIRKVIIGTHIRYFTKQSKEANPVFRLGGFLTKFGDDYKYIILSNGTISWSVQVNGLNDFWSKMNSKEILKTAETEIEEQSQVQNKVVEKYQKLKEKNDYIIDLLQQQKDENEKLKKKLKDIEKVKKKEKK